MLRQRYLKSAPLQLEMMAIDGVNPLPGAKFSHCSHAAKGGRGGRDEPRGGALELARRLPCELRFHLKAHARLCRPYFSDEGGGEGRHGLSTGDAMAITTKPLFGQCKRTAQMQLQIIFRCWMDESWLGPW